MLELMFITNKTEIAKIAENYGTDTIFVDMEFIGKHERQKNLNSVKSNHSIEDVINLRKVINKSNLMVRVNPIHNIKSFMSNKEEINLVVDAGADSIMLPYFKTVSDVECFLSLVNKRCKTILLLETSQAVAKLDKILSLEGIDQVHIGINDLSLCYNKKFMFELFSDGIIQDITNKLKLNNIKFGIGGIGALGKGLVDSELIIKEHYRLGSSAAILSRSFCDVSKLGNFSDIENHFKKSINEIRNYELKCTKCSKNDFIVNKKLMDDKIRAVVRGA